VSDIDGLRQTAYHSRDEERSMRIRSLWVGLLGAWAVSAGAASAATPYCPAIRAGDDQSIDVVRLVVEGTGREIYSARWRNLDPPTSLGAAFAVKDGKMAALEQIRLSIYDQALPPHGAGGSPLVATLKLQGAQWQGEVAPSPGTGQVLDELAIDAASRPQVASAFMASTGAELSVGRKDGGIVALTNGFRLPSPQEWKALSDGVATTMALVAAKTCVVASTTVSADLKHEGPLLIVHGPAIDPASH
jgi:hypothetical protein